VHSVNMIIRAYQEAIRLRVGQWHENKKASKERLLSEPRTSDNRKGSKELVNNNANQLGI
jgi:hypothetical protein